jgi:hypothetical protein
MTKFLMLLICCQILLFQGSRAFAEDYAECTMRCDREYNDCFSEPPAPDPEVQDAKMAACDRNRQTCASECENRKPVETPGTDNNPNIITK